MQEERNRERERERERETLNALRFVSIGKEGVLPINNQNLRRRDVQIGERTFEVVPEFTYLGSKVSNDNSITHTQDIAF